MCLAALSIGQVERFPLVLAANRDEFLSRPAAPLAWWQAAPGGPMILSGRDLEAGGTWLGLSDRRRLALLTNVREARATAHAAAPSRGAIVTDWLLSSQDAETFWQSRRALPYNGFNLIAADLRSLGKPEGRWFWGSNRADEMRTLGAGLYGLSNAALDTPWPKVTRLKARLAEHVAATARAEGSVDDLAARLLGALADRDQAQDDALPVTGVPADWERALSPAYIDVPDRGYGTRCSTVVITESTSGKVRTHVYELTRGESKPRHIAVTDWPP